MPLRLAATRARKIIRMANPSYKFSAEVVNAFTFCAEYITEFVMKEAEKVAYGARKTTLNYDDVRRVIEEQPGLGFLDDTVPQRWVDE